MSQAGQIYTVRDGDDMASIADAHGFFWETLWNHEENSTLKKKRKNPNVLLEGDKVFIPKIRDKIENGADKQRHRFRRKGVPSKLRLKLLRDGEPRVGVEFTLIVDSVTKSGVIGGDGLIEAVIPPGASRATLILKDGDHTEMRTLNLGRLDPINELRGLQQRLQNLGYPCHPSGSMDDETSDAIRAFQAKYDLEPTGKADERFRSKLLGIHGC